MATGYRLINNDQPEYFGLGNMDLAIDVDGHVEVLSGRERVRHDLLKMLLVGQQGFDETITQLLGKKRARGFEGLILMSIQRMVDDYRDNQSPALDDEERVSSIRSLQVFPSREDLTHIVVALSVNMADGQAVEIEHRFGV